MGGTGSTTGAGRPRDARLDAAIVEATVALLEERGYDDTSLAAIADRAGTTTAAIYRRWSSKSELVSRAVFRTDGDDVVADTGDLRADIATMIRWSAEKLCRPAAAAAIAGVLGESGPERAAGALDAAMASHRVEARLERARTAGELRADVDPGVLAATIAGPVIYTVLTGETDRVDEAWIAAQVSVVLDGARPDRRPRSPRRPSRRSPVTDPREVGTR